MRLAGEGVQGAQDLLPPPTDASGQVRTSGTPNDSQSSTMGAPEQDSRILVLFSLANELGLALEPESTWERVLAREMLSKLSRRLGEFVIQSVAFTVRAFPQNARGASFSELLSNDSAGGSAGSRVRFVLGGSSQRERSARCLAIC